ncbi:MAG: ubiE [Herbinix sp.]|jgi:ubiquinone/menaquinone biosynthesis C-methylase UbiE|nr:ubiE [Herbinix sp.]
MNNISLIPSSTLCDGITYATSKIGKKRIEMAEEMINKWACHLMDYGELVTESKSGIIVELATGAGFGTCGVTNSGLGAGKLISIDIDYACAANAIGIAKYLKLEEQIDSMVANFWFLPIKNDSIDVVCSHYGLDEAREVNRILVEISRILKVGGKFINVSRNDPTIRIRQTLGHIEFSKEEYMKLASCAGFYCGMDALKKEAEKNDFVLEYHKVYSPGNSHERVISVFKKLKSDRFPGYVPR